MKNPSETKRVLLPYVRRDETVFVNQQTGELYRVNESVSGKRVAATVIYRGKRIPERFNVTVDTKRIPSIAAFYEASPAPDGTRAVLFLDGRVTRVREADWPKIKRESGIRE